MVREHRTGAGNMARNARRTAKKLIKEARKKAKAGELDEAVELFGSAALAGGWEAGLREQIVEGLGTIYEGRGVEYDLRGLLTALDYHDGAVFECSSKGVAKELKKRARNKKLLTHLSESAKELGTPRSFERGLEEASQLYEPPTEQLEEARVLLEKLVASLPKP